MKNIVTLRLSSLLKPTILSGNPGSRLSEPLKKDRQKKKRDREREPLIIGDPFLGEMGGA
ncbi:MAG: hypothetical protein HQK66_15305 [Desulfamplus sp.]|nr:hypothetical protein [Desulfamplus sp.]